MTLISEEKITHIVHLVFEGLKKGGFVEFSNEGEALREAKRVCFKFVTQLTDVEGVARQRIASQKNAPPERSSQWEILFSKYCEEELRKRGG